MSIILFVSLVMFLYPILILLTSSFLNFSQPKDVYYTFRVNYFSGSPDGVRTCNILGVNGQFPGPTIVANIGDTLHISLKNDIQLKDGVYQNTSLHSHGLLQRGTPFEDGPEMVTQCPIPYSETMQYKFKLEQAGTYWWHSHVHWQYSEGMWGPLIIHNKPEVYGKYYEEEIVITLNDWYHTSGYTNSKWFLSAASGGNEPIPFSFLINGRGSYPCGSTELPCDPENQNPTVFKVHKGKRYRIRVINTSTITAFRFSIENHNLTVIEVDGVDTVNGHSFKEVPIAPAQRYSFIVPMKEGNEGEEFCIRAKAILDMFAFDEPNINPHPEVMISTVTAILHYEGGKGNVGNKICKVEEDDNDMGEEWFPGEELLRPHDLIPAPEKVDQTIVLDVEPVEDKATGINHLTFNKIVFKLSDEPLLTMALQDKPIPDYSNPIAVEFGKVVQIVINNHDSGSHPFHLHGHTFWVLGVGKKNASDFDPVRDQLRVDGVRRDTVQVMEESWAVIRFVADNPGVWVFHCHINWHLQSGLAAVLIEAEKEMKETLRIPDETKRICKTVGINLD